MSVVDGNDGPAIGGATGGADIEGDGACSVFCDCNGMMIGCAIADPADANTIKTTTRIDMTALPYGS